MKPIEAYTTPALLKELTERYDRDIRETINLMSKLSLLEERIAFFIDDLETRIDSLARLRENTTDHREYQRLLNLQTAYEHALASWSSIQEIERF